MENGELSLASCQMDMSHSETVSEPTPPNFGIIKVQTNTDGTEPEDRTSSGVESLFLQNDMDKTQGEMCVSSNASLKQIDMSYSEIAPQPAPDSGFIEIQTNIDGLKTAVPTSTELFMPQNDMDDTEAQGEMCASSIALPKLMDMSHSETVCEPTFPDSAIIEVQTNTDALKPGDRTDIVSLIPRNDKEDLDTRNEMCVSLNPPPYQTELQITPEVGEASQNFVKSKLMLQNENNDTKTQSEMCVSSNTSPERTELQTTPMSEAGEKSSQTCVESRPGCGDQTTGAHDHGKSDTTTFSMVKIVESVGAPSNQELDSSSDSDTDDDSSDSDSSSSSSDETSSDEDSCKQTIRHRDIELAEEIAALKNPEPPKVKGEILPNDLPPVEDLHILLPDEAVLEVIGKVAHIMPDHSVIIQSYPGKPALDFETVLFFARDASFGKVEETFGPVPSPFYVIRFNSEEHLLSKGVELGREVHYAPHIKDFTSFVFVATLRRIRGSDASWCNDQEPPPSCIEYSDDEQEREARRRRKNDGAETENKHKTPTARNTQDSKPMHRGGHRRPRGRGRDRWHNESTRFNVGYMPNPAQTAWQAAVNGMSRQGSERFCHPPPSPGPPPNLLTCFQRPPVDPPGFFGPPPAPPPPYASLQRPENIPYGLPPQNWGRPPPSFGQPSMFQFQPPPPPPPPP